MGMELLWQGLPLRHQLATVMTRSLSGKTLPRSNVELPKPHQIAAHAGSTYSKPQRRYPTMRLTGHPHVSVKLNDLALIEAQEHQQPDYRQHYLNLLKKGRGVTNQPANRSAFHAFISEHT